MSDLFRIQVDMTTGIITQVPLTQEEIINRQILADETAAKRQAADQALARKQELNTILMDIASKHPSAPQWLKDEVAGAAANIGLNRASK